MRILYFTCGCLSFALGFIGAFLPLLPTTPFMILAAFCFSRSSKRLHKALLESPGLGPVIRDWEMFRVIGLRAKVLSTTMMLLMLSYPLFFKPLPIAVKVVIILVAACVLGFIWSCPSRRVQPACVTAELRAPR